MKQVLVIVFAAAFATQLAAQDTVAAAEPEDGATATETAGDVATDDEVAADVDEAPTLEPLQAADISLADFQWLKRPIVVFADTPADPRFQEQMALLLDRPDELLARDVVLIVDTDPKAGSEIRKKLRPRGFMLTLIAKDGRVNLRKPFPWDVREITHAMDKWPIRQQEIRDRKAAAAATE